MISYATTDVGMKRSVNQDTYVLKRFTEKTTLGVVCDGMGGAKGGAEASSIAINAFVREMDAYLSPYMENRSKAINTKEIKNAMEDAIDVANDEVRASAKSHLSLRGMGTTLVACLVIDKTVVFANVGDSRMYVIKGNSIRQMTKDHSYVQHLVDIGQLTPKEAETFPQRNIITKAIGTEETVTPDVYKDTVGDGSMILLCSDGLTNFVKEDTILAVLTENAQYGIDEIELGIRVRKLIDLANKNGGSDNITALVMKV